MVVAQWIFFITAVTLVVNVNFGMPFKGETALILAGSSWSEIKEFCLMYLNFNSVGGIVIGALAFFLLGMLTFNCNHIRSRRGGPFFVCILYVPCLLWNVLFPPSGKLERGIFASIRPYTVLSYNCFSILGELSKGYRMYSDMCSAAYKPQLPDSIEFCGSKTNDILGVVLIGESSSRNYWSLYGYSRKTTPCIDKWQSELFVFKDLVAAASDTTSAERYMFSAAEVETNVPASFYFSVICKRAGYRGVFLSNQGHWGVCDGADALFFHDCEKLVWISDEQKHARYYDEFLLPYVKGEISDLHIGNKVVFVHLMGSHQDAKDRYPHEKGVFGGVSPTSLDHYDNSIHYTDVILDRVLRMVKERGGVSVVIYVSDHGESPRTQYWRYAPEPDTWEIPMFIWLSDEYKKLYPDMVSRLGDAVDKQLVSDQLLYGFSRLFMLSGIPGYSADKDFLSDNFKPRVKRYKNLVRDRIGK